MEKVDLVEPLRAPPFITEEIEQCSQMADPAMEVHKFENPPCPPRFRGLPTLFVDHEEGPAHTPGSPINCEECGKKTAELLINKLHVRGTCFQKPTNI
jgi:hypothetical protein